MRFGNEKICTAERARRGNLKVWIPKDTSFGVGLGRREAHRFGSLANFNTVSVRERWAGPGTEGGTKREVERRL